MKKHVEKTKKKIQQEQYDPENDSLRQFDQDGYAEHIYKQGKEDRVDMMMRYFDSRT